MTQLSITPLVDDDVVAAARLLAEQDGPDRGRFTSARAESEIGHLWSTPGTLGAVARAGREMVGYLLGEVQLPRPASVAALFTPVRGVQIPLAGLAIANSPETDAIVGALYAAASVRWVGAGAFVHSIQRPAPEDRLAASLRQLGFAPSAFVVARDIDPPDTRPAVVPSARRGLAIRRATPDDLGVVVRLLVEQLRGLSSAPVYNPYLPECRSELADTHAEILANDDGLIVLAESEGLPVGVATWIAHPYGAGFAEPAVYLQYLFVTPASRRGGVGRALLDEGLSWARGRGFRSAASTWLAGNIPMSRFLARAAFLPRVEKLTRHLDPSSAWAYALR